MEIIARNRSSEDARGSALGALQARQAADRWHLLVNLREAFERRLDRLRPELRFQLRSGADSRPAVRSLRCSTGDQTITPKLYSLRFQ